MTSGLGWPMHYRYPPLFLLLFSPFTLLPLGWGAALWVVLKVVILVGLVRAMINSGAVAGFRACCLKGPRVWKTYSPPGTGGVAAHQKDGAKLPLEAQTGWSIWNCFSKMTPRLRQYCLTARPPLLLGNTPFSPRSFLIGILFITPYLIEEFRYGNAQFFVLALTMAALLIARERPVLSAASLALGICIKVWPLFFVPYLAARRDWKVVSWTLGFVVLLTLLPSFYFGVQGNLDLIGQWYSQEFQTQLGLTEAWFPNQSLRGVLMRYLTVIDYSRVPDSNYPLVNVAGLDPANVLFLWVAAAGAAYVGLLFIANQSRETNGWFEHGLAFCLLALLEPFTQKYVLSVLLWPALMAGFLLTKPRLRILIYTATILALIQPLIPGSGAQRLLQVLGLDFAAAALLCSAYIVKQWSGRI